MVSNRGQVGRLFIIGIVSLPDYDIGAGRLVLASATTTATFW
jgi:hypothetical protein